jgi:hypothetical protein
MRNPHTMLRFVVFGETHQHSLACGIEVPLTSESFDLELVAGFARRL